MQWEDKLAERKSCLGRERISKEVGDAAKSRTLATVIYTITIYIIHSEISLTNYHLGDKHLVPLEATSHADYSGPPVKASKPYNMLNNQDTKINWWSIILQRQYLTFTLRNSPGWKSMICKMISNKQRKEIRNLTILIETESTCNSEVQTKEL